MYIDLSFFTSLRGPFKVQMKSSPEYSNGSQVAPKKVKHFSSVMAKCFWLELGLQKLNNPGKMTVFDTFDGVNGGFKAIESLLFEVSSISLLRAVILSCDWLILYLRFRHELRTQQPMLKWKLGLWNMVLKAVDPIIL